MDQELSKEEIAKRRQGISDFYADAIKHLKIQKEYEELLRDIEIARAERIQAQVALAQFHASQNPEENPKQEFNAAKDGPINPELEPDLPKRTLTRP